MRLLKILLLCLLPLQGCKTDSVYISIDDKHLYLSSIEKAETIISALESYFDENKEYPAELEELIPSHISEIPQPDRGSGFRYLNPSSYIGYSGPPVYSLIFTPYSLGFFGDSTHTYFRYSSNGDYEESETQKVHYLVHGWAYVTVDRYRIGEGGRIE